MRLNTQFLISLLRITALGFLLPISVTNAAPPCEGGWNPTWSSSNDRWFCVANMQAVCRGGVLRRMARAPFNFICQGTRLSPQIPLGPNCPSNTQYIATSGRCIGTYRLNCPTGFNHAAHVVSRNDMLERGQVLPPQCVRRIAAQETACHPGGKSFSDYGGSTQFDTRYLDSNGTDICFTTYRRNNGEIVYRDGFPVCRLTSELNRYATPPYLISIVRGEDQCVQIDSPRK